MQSEFEDLKKMLKLEARRRNKARDTETDREEQRNMGRGEEGEKRKEELRFKELASCEFQRIRLRRLLRFRSHRRLEDHILQYNHV